MHIFSEVDNGTGSADGKASLGSADKAIVEYKFAKNSHLRNILTQVSVYLETNKTSNAVYIIFYFTYEQEMKVKIILKELNLVNEKSVVVIDARNDNKPSVSKAGNSR